MRMQDVVETIDTEVYEAKPSKEYCKNTPRDKMSNSWESSCVAQGFLARRDDTYIKNKKGKSVKVTGKKKKAEKYGGPVPDHS